MKKIILTVSVLLTLIQAGIAKPVPKEKAKDMAVSFLGRSETYLSRGGHQDLNLVYSEQTQTTDGEEPAYYIFANPQGEGFVIISGDDAIEPVLGYSYENNIDVNNLPGGFKELLAAYKNKISAVKNNHLEATAAVKNAWESKAKGAAVTAVYPVVAPLIKTRWSQDSPFNIYCPGGSLTGCVATAMGQIMYYWNYPATGNGSHSYTPKEEFPMQTVNFGNTTYAWNNMRTVYTSSATQAQKDAVALFLYHCGVSVNTNYRTSGGSGAQTAAVARAVVDFFRYQNTTAYKKYADYSLSAWFSILKSELNNFRPMQMRGDDHSWVCDGYDSNNAFHMNWGFAGTGDGYFLLGDVDFPNMAVVTGIEKQNRVAVSDITSSVTAVCQAQTFTCSVDSDSRFVTYLWTVPKGWSVSGVVSVNGEAISAGNKVTIGTPANYVTTGATERIRVSGQLLYGERTAQKVKIINSGTSTPTFTYTPYIEPGLSEHFFKASSGANIQYSGNNSTWSTAGNSYSVFVNYPATKTVYIRAKNACKVSSSKQYVLKSQVDLGNKLTGITEEEENGFTIDLYPNPASDRISIEASGKIKNVSCFNYLGQPVPVVLEHNTISVADLSNGIYMLNIVNEQGETTVKKFIKE